MNIESESYKFLKSKIIDFLMSKDDEAKDSVELSEAYGEFRESLGCLPAVIKFIYFSFIFLISLLVISAIIEGRSSYKEIMILCIFLSPYGIYKLISKKSLNSKKIADSVEKKYKVDEIVSSYISSKEYSDVKKIFEIIFKEKGYFLADEISIFLENESELVDASYARLTKEQDFKISEEVFFGLVATWAVDYLKNKIRNDFNVVSDEGVSILDRYISIFGNDVEYIPIVESAIGSNHDLHLELNRHFETIKSSKKDEMLDEILVKGKYDRNQISVDDLDFMDGIEFEHFLAVLFKKMGYKAEVTKGSGDQGVDLIIEDLHNKYAVQAKRYSDKVSNTAIQEAYAGMSYYKCSKSMVVTTNYFTKGAIDLAQKNGVELVDRDKLKDYLSKYIIYQSDYEVVSR